MLSSRKKRPTNTNAKKKNASVVKASYEISLLVAKNKKAHSIAENLILPAARILVNSLIGKEEAAKLDNVSLSNNTVKRRIEEMSADIEDQIVLAVKSSIFGFSIQLDESVDVTNCSQLLVYVRYIDGKVSKTDLLLSKELKSTTRGKDVFAILVEFFGKNEFDWKKLIGCTTDGAPSMLGRKSGFQTLIKTLSPDVIGVHCFLHRFALSVKVLLPNLLSCLKKTIKFVNYIKKSSLNSRIFKLICEDLQSDHSSLLFYTEVRWLSRGNMLIRIFELQGEVLMFLKENNKDLFTDFEDQNFIMQMAYLSDIFKELNNFNVSMQGSQHSIAEFISKLQALIKKFEIWTFNSKKSCFGMFKNLAKTTNKLPDDLCRDIINHLLLLKGEVSRYFPNIKCCPYISNPFFVNPNDLAVGTGEQEELIDIQSDEKAKNLHRTCSPIDFWLCITSLYPTLSNKAIKQLLIFPTTWECEKGFSSMMTIKSKSRNRLLNPADDFRCAESRIAPRIDKLVAKKQKQNSH